MSRTRLYVTAVLLFLLTGSPAFRLSATSRQQQDLLYLAVGASVFLALVHRL